MDPISQGGDIFQKIFNKYPNDEIKNIEQVYKLLKEIIEETEGLVILDFLDAGCWDCLGSVEIDEEKGYLILNWHHYSGNNQESSLDKAISTGNITRSLLISFQKLIIGRHEKFPFISIKGFYDDEKKMKNYLSNRKGYNKVSRIDNESNFHKSFVINNEKDEYYFDCYNTPIYSLLIIPKNTAGSSRMSLEMLFKINFHFCLQRLEKIEAFMKSNKLDEDDICEKSNTIRRIMESFFKIECCYQNRFRFLFDDDVKISEMYRFNFKKEYKSMLYGDLVKLLKPIKTEGEKRMIKQISIISNELSHDSGLPITLDKLKELLKLSIEYTTPFV